MLGRSQFLTPADRQRGRFPCIANYVPFNQACVVWLSLLQATSRVEPAGRPGDEVARVHTRTQRGRGREGGTSFGYNRLQYKAFLIKPEMQQKLSSNWEERRKRNTACLSANLHIEDLPMKIRPLLSLPRGQTLEQMAWLASRCNRPLQFLTDSPLFRIEAKTFLSTTFQKYETDKESVDDQLILSSWQWKKDSKSNEAANPSSTISSSLLTCFRAKATWIS